MVVEERSERVSETRFLLRVPQRQGTPLPAGEEGGRGGGSCERRQKS